MMKRRKAIIKSAMKRSFAAIMAVMTASGVLMSGYAFAVEDNEADEAAVLEELQPDENAAVEVTTEEDGTLYASTQAPVIKDGDGNVVDVETGAEWREAEVIGGDSPTAKAMSVEQYIATQSVRAVEAEDSLYTLTVATGMNAGTSVEYFAIRYKDKNDVSQTKYIFPKIHSLKAADDYLQSLGSEREMLVNVKGTVRDDRGSVVIAGKRYSAGESVDITFDEDDWRNTWKNNIYDYLNRPCEVMSHWETVRIFDPATDPKHNALSTLGYKENESALSKTALGAWSVDEFLFKADTGLKKVTGIEAFMSPGKWTVNGISVSKVTKLNGYGEYGFYSGKYFLALDKKKICQLKSYKSGAQTFSASGDTLLNIGGDKSTYYSLQEVSADATSSSSLNDIYSFRLDFADNLDSGLESLLRPNTNNIDPAYGDIIENLAFEVEYRDKNGCTRIVTMPVLLSVLGQYLQSGDSVKTIGLAQRGDTLAFSGCLPEFDSLLSTKLYVGKAARDRLKETGGFELTGNVSDAVVNSLNSDYIELSGVSIYKGTCRMSNFSDGVDTLTNQKLKCLSYGFDFFEPEPLYYYTTTSPDGFMMNPNTSSSINMKPYNHNDPIIASSIQGNFLIRLRTDDVSDLCSTNGDIKVMLKYQTYSGSQKLTPNYDVRKEVLNYIGYWPSSESTLDNFAYSYGTTKGKYVEFPIYLEDVAAVNEVNITLGDFSDDWQLSGISIDVLDGIGKRRIYIQDLESQSSKSQFRIVRTLKKTVLPPYPMKVQRYFSPGDGYTYSTGSNTYSKIEEADFNSVRYSMTYEQTKENYGYAKRKKVYDINVKVADDDSKNNINGDAGSKNLFYFQLLFKNGNSAFVLANQQLSSDAFRAGYNEMFTISVNRDYGDVTAVRIIPESTTEESELFDKLNIEELTITERNNGGSGMQYVINSVGWIGIDYHDSGDDRSLAGRKGHSVSELANTYTISAQRKVVNMLCEITAKAWDINFIPVSASISCDLEYIDTDDQPRTLSFDVVDRMYDYMKQPPKTLEAASDGSNTSLYVNMGAISDPKTMLIPNQTDRFIIPPIADAKVLKRMTFRATNRGDTTAKWIIGDLTISRIESDSGIIQVLENGQLYRNMVVEEHCKMVSKSEWPKMTIPQGLPQELTIDLTETEIDWIEGTAWISAITRLPESTNDTLNLYVYPTSGSRNIAGINVGAALQYTIPNSKLMQVSQSTLNISGSGTSDAMFFYSGLPASNMQNLSELRLQCRDAGIGFDHAIVQQVRDNVVVGTYYISLGSQSAVLGLRASPSTNMINKNPTRQELMLSFDESTTEMSLFNSGSDVNDIAVAIKYRSSIDGYSEYYSPYVYLTDVGINKIMPGMMATVPFDMHYVDEVLGYRIASFGNISAGVNAAQLQNYSYSKIESNYRTGEETRLGEKYEKLYSFNNAYKVSNSVRDVAMTDVGCTGSEAVNLLDITFTTAEAVAGAESGTDSPVEMTIYYQNSSGADRAMAFADIRTYIQGEDKRFVTGEAANIRLFLPDCDKLTSIRIRPYNETGDASWTVEKISGSIGVDNDKRRARVDRLVGTEFLQSKNGDEISLKSVSMLTYVGYHNTVDWVGNHKEGYTIEEGESATFTVMVSGGFTAKAEWLVNGERSDATSRVLFAKTENGVSFIAPTNEGSSPLTYIVTIAAVENPSVKDVITFNIPATQKEPVTTIVERTVIGPAADTSPTETQTTVVETTSAEENITEDEGNTKSETNETEQQTEQ